MQKIIDPIRTLYYNLDADKLNEIKDSIEFRDIVRIGGLVNAIKYAERSGLSHQIVHMRYGKMLAKHFIYISDGMLYEGMKMSMTLVERYENEPYVAGLAEFVRSFMDYEPHKVLMLEAFPSVFHIRTDDALTRETLRLMDIRGKSWLMRYYNPTRESFGVAQIVDESETMDDLKRGKEPEVHMNMESVINYMVDEFISAAEDFIDILAARLGMPSGVEAWDDTSKKRRKKHSGKDMGLDQ